MILDKLGDTLDLKHYWGLELNTSVDNDSWEDMFQTPQGGWKSTLERVWLKGQNQILQDTTNNYHLPKQSKQQI